MKREWIVFCYGINSQLDIELNQKHKTKQNSWRKGHPETAPPGNPLHIQTPKPDIIADAKKCLLKGVWYRSLLRSSARAWQIQRQKLTTIFEVSTWSPVEELEKGLKELYWLVLCQLDTDWSYHRERNFSWRNVSTISSCKAFSQWVIKGGDHLEGVDISGLVVLVL